MIRAPPYRAQPNLIQPTTYNLPSTTYHLHPTTYNQQPTTYHLHPTYLKKSGALNLDHWDSQMTLSEWTAITILMCQ